MMKHQTAKFTAFRTLLNISDFLTPAIKMAIIDNVITKANTSGGPPKKAIVMNATRINHIILGLLKIICLEKWALNYIL